MANNPSRPNLSREDLEARLQVLEEQARFTLDVLEMATNLGDFQTSINKLQEPTEILRETAFRVQGFIHFRGSAFYLVNEASSDFVMTLCEPREHQGLIEAEIGTLIDSGIFALALRENRPITVYSQDKKHRLVLHVLSTSSRTRGLFVGLLHRADRNISSMLLSLLSIILKNCANAIESFELYRLLRRNEQRYRDLANALPLTVFELDRAGRVRFVNSAVSDQFGLTREEVEQGMDLVELLVPQDRERARQDMEQCMLGQGNRCFAYAAQGKDGRAFAAEVHVGPMQDAGRCVGLRGILLATGHRPPGSAGRG